MFLAVVKYKSLIKYHSCLNLTVSYEDKDSIYCISRTINSKNAALREAHQTSLCLKMNTTVVKAFSLEPVCTAVQFPSTSSTSV